MITVKAMYNFVSVFKTNIQTLTDKLVVLEGLRSLRIPIVVSLDLEDEDRVLRVESPEHIVSQVLKKVDEYDFKCEELDSFVRGVPLGNVMLS
ncbi:hypothetical protein SAMN05660841_01407 [Sphingobacterium nematocida]|uniref:Uncharacterized protein n=1 Tax=Sphingobacterium nematocida TaxID=1513896 RepID=A0A1T5CKW7_9SPHI|nr:hypothetical protein [Sphingobacterium nematocida]SKB60128.1 hypothetical protein SAMN05660841_01407 [Sphingobacterium nematocida]